MSLLHRIQAWAPVPVYPVIGEGAVADIERLRLGPALTFVSSIRHASILLVAGTIRSGDQPALRRLHDQLPHPRATLWWRSKPLGEAIDPVREEGDDPVLALRSLDRQLRTGECPSEADWLSNVPPNRWQGEGDYGQGGKGMMGGVPYGRPMAMTDDDQRDGLSLDAMTVRIGPFVPMLPAGLSLELTLQGDVIQRARVLTPALPAEGHGQSASLRQAAILFELLGLDALAARCFRSPDRRALCRAARRSGAFLAIPPDLGIIEKTDVRTRLRDALLGEQPGLPLDAQPLGPMLTGLEWQEAMLVINSIPVEQLAIIAQPTPCDGGAPRNQIQRSHHRHHGGHA
jgi:hypothetical protein